MSNAHVDGYLRRYEGHLRVVAQKLQDHIEGFLGHIPNVERVTARAKDPKGYAEKASRKDDDGNLRYQNPLSQIQDQIGARVIVFYHQDVEAVTAEVERYFQPIEQKELIPESEWEFGYFGRHLVIPLPGDVVPKEIEVDQVPRFFELQVKTLFQHAWSEANHEIGYKSPGTLSSSQQRRLAYTAAMAWGADREFAELNSEI